MNQIKRALAKDLVRSAVRNHGGIATWYHGKENDYYLGALYNDGCFEELEAEWDDARSCWWGRFRVEVPGQVLPAGWGTCGQLKVG